MHSRSHIILKFGNPIIHLGFIGTSVFLAWRAFLVPAIFKNAARPLGTQSLLLNILVSRVCTYAIGERIIKPAHHGRKDIRRNTKKGKHKMSTLDGVSITIMCLSINFVFTAACNYFATLLMWCSKLYYSVL